MRAGVGLLVGLLLLAGPVTACSDGAGRDPSGAPSAEPSTASEQASTSTADTAATAGEQGAPAQTETATGSTTPTPTVRVRRVRERGIDVSHHQGDIDWPAVAGDDVAFAYLKATEGTSFTDPRFIASREAARAAGLEVGSYHYFQLCSPGREQADHFVETVGRLDHRLDLPGAIDLELAGSCSEPPPRGELLAEVRSFLDQVEEGTGKRPIVYSYPEFEARYGFADDLTGYRQWVRSLEGRPERAWWIWQRSQTATVAGVDGPTDLNLRVRRERIE